jgi:hypothetical protein
VREGIWDLSATISLAVVALGAGWLGAKSLLLGVKVVSDGPIYHLYFAARWWKAGHLSLIPTPFGENAAPYFPANGDLWFTWLMECWGGDRLARVGQAPLLLLAGLTAYALARRLGAGGLASTIAAAWFVTCTPLCLFSFEPNVDTCFVALYLLGAFFLVSALLGDGSLQLGTLALAGLAAGGALGTKATGVVFVPPLLLVGLVGIWARKTTAIERFTSSLVLLLTPLALSGFWFARNAVLTGNPLYPLHAVIGRTTLLSGWYGTDVMRLSRYYIPRDDWRSAADILLAVLDPRLVPFWCLALGGAWAIASKRRVQDRWVWACSALALANIALYWFMIPYRTQQRFMLHAVGLAAVPLARLFDRATWLRWAGVGLLAVHMTTYQPWPFAGTDGAIPWDQNPRILNAVGAILPLIAEPNSTRTSAWTGRALLIAGLAPGALVMAWLWGSLVRRPSLVRLGLATATSVAFFAAACVAVYPWNMPPRARAYWEFYPYFADYNRGWEALERLSPPGGTRVAYAGTNLPYYLMASRLRNDVQYVNVDAHPTWLLHDYHRQAQAEGQPTWPHPRPGWDRIAPDYSAWLANLRHARIQLLVVARANPDEGPHNVADSELFPIERGWTERHPESFTPLYGVVERDPEFRIYRVLTPEQISSQHVTDGSTKPH